MAKLRNGRIMSMLIAVLMMMNMFMTAMPAYAATPVTVAAWDFASVPESASIQATGGVHKEGAVLSNSMGNIPNYTSSNSTIYTNGWNYNPADQPPKYWEFSLSTAGCTGLKFTAKAYSTNTGPRDFKIICSSNDGTSWDEIPGSSRVLTTSLPSSPTWNEVALPDTAENQSRILLRLVMSSNSSANGGTVATGGNSRLAAISITGIYDSHSTAPVITHTPVSMAYAASDITISAAIDSGSTVTAAVYYGTTADGNGFINRLSMANTSGNVYSAVIANPSEGDLYYYIAAANISGETATHPADITKSHKITVSSPISTIDISEARTKAIDTIVSVIGVVTYIDGNNYYIQDATGGIDVYKSGLTLSVGDRVSVTGKLQTYNGLLEVVPEATADVTVLSSGNALPAPKSVTIAEINASGGNYESQLVRLERVTLGAINTIGNTPITDSPGNTINIYRLPSLSGIAEGDVVDIIAIVSRFNVFQLRVRSAADVTLADLGPDTEPPVIIHTPVTAGNTGIDLEIQASITDDRKLVYEAVYYRTTGIPVYMAIAMDKGAGSAFSAVIPKSALDTAGLQYYIEAGDGTNVVTSPADKTAPYNVAISDTDILGPEITNLLPASGTSTGADMRPVISASFSDQSGINIASVRLLLDAVDITAEAAVTSSGITYTPSSDLARKSYSVELRVSDTLGNETVMTWSFRVGEQSYVPDGEIGTAVLWDLSYPSQEIIPQPVPGTGGDFDTISELSCWAGTLKFSSGGASCEGWNNGANNKYWMVRTSTKGMGSLSLSWRMRSSGTGPRDFKVQYGTDGGTWTDIPGASIQVPFSSTNNSITNSTNLFSIDLPAEAENQDILYLRWLMTSETSANGGTVGAGGTHQINSISITGAYLVGDNQVRPVSASIPEGPVPLGSAVTFLSATEDAVVKYNTDGGNTYGTAANGRITLDTLPVTLYVKAVKAGMDDSRVKSFMYTQAKVEPVSASRKTGAIPANSVIVLTTVPADATIKYVLTKKAGTAEESALPEATYTAPIALAENMFPVRITAKASKENYLDSDPVSFSYTIKSTGGEKNYFGQIHSHTENSDGAGTLNEAFTWARDNAGLDFFAVTDHSNSFDTASSDDKAGTYNLGDYNKDNAKWQAGKAAAAAAAVPGKFVSFYGYEMTWSGGPGHINTYGTEGFVSRNNSELNSKNNDAGLKAYYELLKLHPESISQFNHPGTTFGNFSGFAYHDPIIDERISLIEVGNGEGAIGSGGYFPSYEQYDMALDKGWHLAPTNNQDNHKGVWGNANTGRTVVYTNDFTTEGIYQALRDMRVYATEDENLDIIYTLNGEQLGTSLDTVPAEAAFKVTAKNTAGTNKVESIAIITNGGTEAYKETYGTAEAVLDYVMDAPKVGYYYIKVVQEDGRIAVTAPIWLGRMEAVGISDVRSSTSSPVTTEELTLTTEIFNNEAGAVTLDSVRYEIKGGAVIADNALGTVIEASSSVKHTQSFTPVEARKTTIIVTATMTIKGTVRTFTKELDLQVRDIEKLMFIGIDASHLNEYVAGNYKDSMKNFSELAMKYGLRTVILNTSEEFTAAAANPRYKMLIITAPTRRLEPAANHKCYSDAELDAVAAFARQGKPVIVTGWGDYYEGYDYVEKALEKHMAWQQNKLLEAIGATLRIADDEAKDDVKNGGQPQRLYLEDYNGKVSPLLEGLLEGQKFSQYGGATIYAINPDGTPAEELPESVIPIISGHETTYSSDDDNDGYGFTDPIVRIPRYGNSPDAGKGTGKVLLTASETIDHGNGVKSQVIVSGGAFMSDFEIKNAALDNPADAYSNEVIVRNLLSAVENITVTPIAEVKGAALGTEFTIEGIATSGVYDGTSDNNTGFFDSIYVQDATAGINLFPVSAGVQAGQKIRATGTVGAYQGETQLTVTDIKVLDKAIVPVAPKVVSTRDAMAAVNTGRLIRTTGYVKGIVAGANGAVNQITIDDGTGAAIVYINFYITPGKNLSFVTPGAYISVTGLGSIGENFTSATEFLPRIRVRDRGEIKLVSAPQDPDRDREDRDDDTGTNPPAAAPKPPELGANGAAKATISTNMMNTLIQRAAKAAADTGHAEIEISAIAPPGAQAISVAVPAGSFESIAEAGNTRIKIDTGIAAVTFDEEAVKAISKAGSKGEVELSVAVVEAAALSAEAQAIVGNHPVYDFSITSDGKKINGFEGGKALVSIPYTLQPGEDAESVVLFRINSAGELEAVRCRYNAQTKCIEAVLGHFSIYAIAYNRVSFRDVPANAWYAKAVAFIASRGITSGIGNGCYGPSEKLTREQFLVMLMKALGIAPDITAADNFDDVGDNYAAPYISAARRLGITSGIGGNKFGPAKELSRQEMFVMLHNALKVTGELPASKPELSIDGYEDLHDVADWARPAVTHLIRSGLVSGTGGNRISPLSVCDRAAAARIIYNLLR